MFLSTVPFKNHKTFNIVFWITISVIVSRILIYLLFLFVSISQGLDFSFVSFCNKISIYDCGWYKSIIQEGYGGGIDYITGQANWAFFPMFPLLIYFLHLIVPIDVYLLGMIVNTIILIFICYFVYKYYILTRKDESGALLVVIILIFGPFSWYCSILYSESIFMFLAILFLYLMKREKYVLMGVTGMLLSATRNTGVFFLFIPFIYSIVQYFQLNEKGKRSFKSFLTYFMNKTNLILGICLVPIGLFSYMLFLYVLLGDGLAFVHVQYAWGRKFVGFFYTMVHGAKDMPLTFIVTIVGIGLSIYLCFEKRFEEAIYPLLVIFVAGTTTLQSMQRYIFSSLTPLFALVDCLFLLKNKKIRIPLNFCFLICLSSLEMYLAYLWMFDIGFYFIF